MRNRLLPGLAGACLAAALGSAAEVPRPSPDFIIDLPGGKQIPLSQYRGKVCALAFIRTTCPHCQKTVGYLTALQNEFGPRGLQVVASATDEMAGMLLPDFVQHFKPSFPVGFNNYNAVVEYLQHDPMFKLYVPQLVFIDRQGTIRAQYEGGDKFFVDDQEKHLREQVEALLKEAPVAVKKRGIVKAGTKSSATDGHR